MTSRVKRKPSLSLVVVVYNIPRQARRTLLSLSADYQRHIGAENYEVIVVDNGSNPPINKSEIEHLRGNFRLIRLDPALPSPAQAINRGLAEAHGDIIGVMIDGARIVTPGLLHFARCGADLYGRAVVATLGWYLGFDFQSVAMDCGHDHDFEESLLNSIDWPADGYRLFEIGTMDESSCDGWFQTLAESNALFMKREMWDLLGGFDERFDAPGGGLVNLDTFRRALELPDAELVILVGEATFHQFHGGTNTNASLERQIANWRGWARQYTDIRGFPWKALRPPKGPTYIGALAPAVLPHLVRTAVYPGARFGVKPLGEEFRTSFWVSGCYERPGHKRVAELIDLLHTELLHHRFEAACELARLIREHAPEEPEPKRLLSLLAGYTVPGDILPAKQRAESYVALGDAYRVLGNTEMAAMNFERALVVNPNVPRAQLGLAAVKMPGDDYLVWLDRLYRWLTPKSVIEIGVEEGASLAILRPPTVAIGIDPAPKLIHTLQTEVHVFAETSDEFFARRRHEVFLQDHPLSVGFIDGLHLFEQSLKDFINLEACCGPGSVILLHDTLPLDEPTQRRQRETQFHTGDVWKTILCLKHYRPDLTIVTIATPPTGLTLITSLDPKSRALSEKFDEALTRFTDLPFSVLEGRLNTMLNVLPNDSSVIHAHLMAQGILA